MTTTYYARKDYTYESGDRIFTIPFSYLKESHIKIFINDEETENFSFNTSSQIAVNDELEAGDIVSVRRSTPIDARMVTFTNTSILNKDNQNISAQQTFNMVQEIYDNNTTFEIHVEGDIGDIQDEVDTANETANTALSNSQTAISTANTAEAKGDTAISTANGAVTTANQANTKSDNAVSTANSATQTANAASQLSNETKDRVDEFEVDIEEVKEAAAIINELEEAVAIAAQAAGTATAQAQTATSETEIATSKALEATTAAQTATTQAEEAKAKVGDLSNLTTTAKNTVIAAINEVNAKPSVTSLSALTDVSLTSLVDKNILSYNSTTQKWENIEQESGGVGLITGQTIFSLDPLINAGLHPLDGTELPVGGIYDDFITNYIVPLYTAHPERFKTEAEWQAIYSEKGICDYYVYTAGTSVRLPKLGNKLYDTNITDVVVVGTGMTLGLEGDNGYGGLGYYNASFSRDLLASKSAYGKDIGSDANSDAPDWTNGKSLGITTDGTKSGIIAKTSNINTEATTGYYYIVVSTVTKTDIEVDIDEIVTDLNNKVDTSSLEECIVVVEDWHQGTEGYTIWSNGRCEQWGRITAGGAVLHTINLLKIYKDSTYNVISGVITSNTGQSSNNLLAIQNLTPNSFQLYNLDGMVKTWKTVGYLAEGEY
jgi:hypothetical protein